MKSLPSSTSGIIEMLVIVTINHCKVFSVVKLNKVAKNGVKYIPSIIKSKKTKLKLKNLFLKIFILKILRSDLQFIAWIICIKQMVINDIVLAILEPNL